MAWVESHTVLMRHRKLAELARGLRIRRAHASGHLHALWHAALEQQDDGDLTGWSDEFIAEMSDVPSDAPQYVRLLQTTGFLGYKDAEGNLIPGTERLIHDWVLIAGNYLSERYRFSRKRRERIWSLHGKTLPPQRQLRDIKSSYWKRVRRRVFQRDNFTCQYCGRRGGNLEADHVHPYSKGGSSTEKNLVTSCRPCNRKKGNRTVHHVA